MADDHIKILEERLKRAEEALAKHQSISDSMTRYAKRGMQVTIRELSKTNAALESAEKKLVEQNHELAQLNQLKDRFMGVAAHDLKNPLQIIKGLAQLLEISLQEERWADERKMLNTIKETTTFMTGIINNFLDHNMIESGKFPVSKNIHDLNKLALDIVEQQQLKARSEQIELITIQDDALKPFQFDAERMSQVFQNLIGNALKFSGPHSRVTIKTHLDDGFVHVSVEDQGPGIPESEIQQVFEPFQQTSVKSTKDETGSGLGLYIVKKILEAHDGSISLVSEMGKGTVFHLTLPYIQE